MIMKIANSSILERGIGVGFSLLIDPGGSLVDPSVCLGGSRYGDDSDTSPLNCPGAVGRKKGGRLMMTRPNSLPGGCFF